MNKRRTGTGKTRIRLQQTDLEAQEQTNKKQIGLGKITSRLLKTELKAKKQKKQGADWQRKE
jgi:hypothetical protein